MKYWLSLLVVVQFFTSVAQTPKVKITNIGKPNGAPAFSFVHITDVHIGEHTPGGDYGTHGYFDTLTGKEGGYSVERLSSSIAWINKYYAEYGIKFVVVSGDITDSGEKSEFYRFKHMMDTLKVPYIPLMGNHDAWPYNRFGDEAPYACGDSIMNEIFGSTFKNLKNTFTVNSDSRLTAWKNPESNTNSYLQNFSLSYMGYNFMFLDFNPRYHVHKDEPGIGPEAQLMDYNGGSLPYMRTTLLQAQQKNEKVFLVSHHPPIKNVLGTHYAYTPAEKKQVTQVLKPHSKTVKGWFCGHLHRWWKYRLFNAGGINVYETRANKAQDFGGFRVVRVFN
jgi:predicted MPP superfamily phosphohydrolase